MIWAWVVGYLLVGLLVVVAFFYLAMGDSDDSTTDCEPYATLLWLLWPILIFIGVFWFIGYFPCLLAEGLVKATKAKNSKCSPPRD